MPRIRKKTSKRGTSHQRGKIRQKVSETRRKRKKEAKKNPQWKSKHSKDPGIPNNFPYKDQILAEVSEQRGQEAQMRLQQKESRKAAKQDTALASSDTEGKDLDQVSSAQPHVHSKTTSQATSEQMDVPLPINPDLRNLQAVLDHADVVIEVLDARDPSSFRSLYLEGLVIGKEKRLILLLNKIDLCPKEAVQAWLNELGSEYPTIPFRSASTYANPETVPRGQRVDDAIGAGALLGSLEKLSQEKGPLTVAIVGLANVGKSSVVNSLVRKRALTVYQPSTYQDQSTTTNYAQEISLDVNEQSIRLIDTPGIAWTTSPDQSVENDSSYRRVRDILLRNRGRIDRLKDPIPAVADMVSRTSREDLMLFYSIPAFMAGDANGFLSALARSNNLLKKDGGPDLAAACRVVLKDWNSCKFPYYTFPAVNASSVSEHDEILGMLRSRKDWRKAPGLIRFHAGSSDPRHVVMDLSWAGDVEEDSEDSISDVDEGAADESIPLAEGESADEHSSIDQDPKAALLSSAASKRKRTTKTREMASRPVKRVTFASLTLETCRAHKRRVITKPPT